MSPTAKDFIKAFSLAMLGALIIGALVILGIKAIVAWSEQPAVHISYSSGQCVKVESVEGNYSCNNMPAKYDRVWVK